MVNRSPLAPDRFPDLPAVGGVRMAARACGIRYTGRADVLLVVMPEDTAVAGLLTRSATASAPVDWCRACLPRGRARALLVNAGNANAFTGPGGLVSVRRCAAACASTVGCDAEDVYIASTGVIGEPLPDQKITGSLATLYAGLSDQAWEPAARAIMTTDTFPKASSRWALIDSTPVCLAGIAKGSGMIAPDMATMLAFLFTDAAIAPDVLDRLLREAAERSFNAITVDSDTSTSDALLLFATGTAGHEPVTDAADRRRDDFRVRLLQICTDLAHQVVRDGEGASRFITVRVTGAETDAAAKRIALSIANSPLVKTAIAGGDANWGRIVMAVGKAGEQARREALQIRLGGHLITEAGGRRPGYDEGPIAAHMRGREIDLAVDVGIGNGAATIWTCDLTHRYIDINADYRT